MTSRVFFLLKYIITYQLGTKFQKFVTNQYEYQERGRYQDKFFVYVWFESS